MKEKFQIGAKGGVFGKMGLGKLALIAAGIVAIGAVVKKLLGKLIESSPYLKGVFSLFKQSSLYFFRPFGDFLATLLKPLALLLLQAAAGWMEYWRGGKEEEKPFDLGEWLDKYITAPFDIGEWLGEHILVGIFDFSEWLGKKLFLVSFDFGKWLGEQYIWAVDWVAVFGEWLFNKSFDAGKWLGEQFATWFIIKPFNVGEWLGEQFATWFIIKPFNAGEWLGENFRSFIRGEFDLGGWLGENFRSFIRGEFDIGEWIKGLFRGKKRSIGYTGSWQAGTDFVPKTGLYQLHRGEAVIPAGRNKTTIYRPTFNFMGTISSDIDIDSVMRRASRQSELSLRRLV